MKSLNLLLVEDTVISQNVMSLLLEMYGFKIDIAHNGLEAVEKFKEGYYDIILMDIIMPVQNGYEATKTIRELEKIRGGHVLIIGLTAQVYDSEEEKCIAAGMDKFLTKPFDIEMFKKTLKSLGFNIFDEEL